MILLNHPQGSHDWRMARLCIPTASQFKRIVTPKRLEPSESCWSYLCELLAEWQLGEPCDSVDNPWTKRGTEQEDRARGWYEWERNVDVQPGGFCLLDSRKAGCSPDGLVGDDGLVEIKVPSAAKHVGYLLGDADEYTLQVQGQLWICERQWCDRVTYNSHMPSLIRRVERDEAIIAKLSAAVLTFTERLEAERERLVKEYGCKGWEPPARCEHDVPASICRVCHAQEVAA